MKKLFLLICLLFTLTQGFARCQFDYPIPLIGEQAPRCIAKAVIGQEIIDEFNLEDLRGQYVILFFYPLDFTFICPTELHAFQNKLKEFQQRKAQVVACSVDSVYSHLAWLNTPSHLGGIEGVEYPILSDLDKSISRYFHVLNEKEGIALRGLYLIDREGIIRHCLINDLNLGRDVNEVLRVLDALILQEKTGTVCPANWHPGEKTLTPTPQGLLGFFKEGG